MSLSQVGGGATSSVAPMPFQSASSASTASVDKTRQAREEELNDLLEQLSELVDQSVKQQDSRSTTALLQHLAGQGTGEALPPELVARLDSVIETATQAGKADEFKALLSEYVAVQWALSEINEMIAQHEAAATRNEDDFNKLVAAQAFLKQLETALAGRLDSQGWYANWRELSDQFLQDLAEAPVGAPDSSDPVALVQSLLQTAPRPDLSHHTIQTA